MSDQASVSAMLLIGLWIVLPLAWCAYESLFARDRSWHTERLGSHGRRGARLAVARSDLRRRG